MNDDHMIRGSSDAFQHRWYNDYTDYNNVLGVWVSAILPLIGYACKRAINDEYGSLLTDIMIS